MSESNGVIKTDKKTEVKKAIQEYLDEYGQVRAGELARAVCSPPPAGKGICSEKIHYRYLKELVDANLVKKSVQNRGNITYATPSWDEQEEFLANLVNTYLDSIRSRLEFFKEMKFKTADELRDFIAPIYLQMMDLHGITFLQVLYSEKTTTSEILAKLSQQDLPNLANQFLSILTEFDPESRQYAIGSLLEYQKVIINDHSDTIFDLDKKVWEKEMLDGKMSKEEYDELIKNHEN